MKIKNIVYGMGTVLDLAGWSGNNKYFSQNTCPWFIEDAKSILSDWDAVAKDFNNVIGKIENLQDISTTEKIH